MSHPVMRALHALWFHDGVGSPSRPEAPDGGFGVESPLASPRLQSSGADSWSSGHDVQGRRQGPTIEQHLGG